MTQPERNYELLKSLSVLYVEDDPFVRESLIRFLRRRFDTLHVAEDGRNGLELYTQHKPDLVISDIQMPVMDGLEMCRHIREIDREVPILITTAFNETSYLMKAIELGVDRYVKKPVVKEELLDSLYRSAQVLIQRKELEARNRVIESVLDWHPCFTILIESRNLEFMNRRLLTYLGYETVEEFIANNGCADPQKEALRVIEGQAASFCEEAIKEMIGHPEKDHVIYLKNKESEAPKGYVVKVHPFPETDMYLLAFLEPDEVMTDSYCQSHCAIPCRTVGVE